MVWEASASQTKKSPLAARKWGRRDGGCLNATLVWLRAAWCAYRCLRSRATSPGAARTRWTLSRLAGRCPDPPKNLRFFGQSVKKPSDADPIKSNPTTCASDLVFVEVKRRQKQYLRSGFRPEIAQQFQETAVPLRAGNRRFPVLACRKYFFDKLTKEPEVLWNLPSAAPSCRWPWGS